jgi:CBS domain-containing protein
MMLRHGVRHLVVRDAAGRPRGVLTLTIAAWAALGADDVPTWLAGLRAVLGAHPGGR